MAEIEKRTYGDACRTAMALDVIGDRWALLVVRELLFGPRRFTDIAAGLPKASPDMLARRLRELANGGAVAKRRLDPPAASTVYELTNWGAQLEPIIVQLANWAHASPTPLAEGDHLSASAFLGALRTHYDTSEAPSRNVVVEMRIDGESYRVAIVNRRLRISREPVSSPDAVIRLETLPVANGLWGDRSFSSLEREGALDIEGDHELATTLLASFARPPSQPPAKTTG